jgi:predicted GNAT superfamily acetyltransferase
VASAWYFPLLGGAGVAGHAGDLAAQLQALKDASPLPALNSAAAVSFNGATVAEQITRTIALVGAADWDAVLLQAMQRVQHDPQLGLATARMLFAALPAREQQAAVGAALATAWAAIVPLDQQRAQAAAMAASQSVSHNTELINFMVERTGHPVDTLEALTAFAALPKEQQLLFTDRVLVAELRSSGRAASALSGDARDAAYARGYAALDSVFTDATGGPARRRADGARAAGRCQRR